MNHPTLVPPKKRRHRTRAPPDFNSPGSLGGKTLVQPRSAVVLIRPSEPCTGYVKDPVRHAHDRSREEKDREL